MQGLTPHMNDFAPGKPVFGNGSPRLGNAVRLPRGRRLASGAVLAAGLLAMCLFALGLSAAVASAAEGFRPLAPGVLTVIAPFTSAADTVVRGDITEITVGHANLAWKPRQAAVGTTFVARARDLEYPRDIWCLEFAFKPPRTIEIDVPTRDLRMQRKRIWYVVYRVRNVGGRRSLIDSADPSVREVQTFDASLRFTPQFVFESRQPLAAGEGSLTYRAYLDRVIPAALEPIRRREHGDLFDSAAMAAAEIPPSGERWGVATWEDVDPRIDFFSIYVTGLTNALQWRQRAGVAIAADDEPGSGRERTLQSLRLDFWRPATADATSVGFIGMFERMALGGRLLADAGRPQAVGSDPLRGLGRMKLGWEDLLAPVVDDDPSIPDWQPLGPLKTVLERLGSVEDKDTRLEISQDVFGDIGVGYLQELADALSGVLPGASPDQSPDNRPADNGARPLTGPERRAALERLGLADATLPPDPLAALTALLPGLDALPPGARRSVAEAIVGPAATRLDWLAREVGVARTLGALGELGVDPAAVLRAGDGRAAFDTVQPFLAAEPDPARRRQLIRGLFGPRGPALQAAATAVHEGIDHAWVYRYED
jgi:hypothetical protein